VKRHRAIGDQKRWVIAVEWVTKLRSSVTIDCTMRESAGAEIDVGVKRILNTLGYTQGLQHVAAQTVLLQAESLCNDWAA